MPSACVCTETPAIGRPRASVTLPADVSVSIVEREQPFRRFARAVEPGLRAALVAHFGREQGLEALNDALNAVLVTLEVNDPITLLMAATLVTNRDPTLIVAATTFLLRHQQ